MKKIFTLILTTLALGLALQAQDARQRTVDTIVGDVLSQMPAQNAAAQESDVSIVMDSGTFCPTLYVHDGQGGSFYTLAGVDSMEALREMAASVIREKASNAKAYLLDYAAFYTHEGVRKGALIMETASRADAQATVLVFVCDRDGKKTEGPVQRPGVPSLFR